MNYPTFATLDTEVRGECDMLDEDTVSTAQMISYANRGIEMAEASILTLYEDYFRTKALLSTVQGTSAYALPTNIYANKIRGIMWARGSEIYEVLRLRASKGSKVMEQIASINQAGAALRYQYDLDNVSAAAGVSMTLLPAARETAANVMTIWYIRHANRIVATTDVCDIPEFSGFVKAYMKYMALSKEGMPLMDDAKEEMQTQMQLMIDTLQAMVPDEENEIIPDTSFYEEHA